MLHRSLPINKKSIQVRSSTFYKKAIGLYELSQQLNEYNHRTSLDITDARSYSKSLVEDVVVLSIRLPFTIVLAQTTPDYKNRLHALQTLSESIVRLKNHCKQLDIMDNQANSQARRLKQELQSFSKLFKSWRLVLTRQN